VGPYNYTVEYLSLIFKHIKVKRAMLEKSVAERLEVIT